MNLPRNRRFGPAPAFAALALACGLALLAGCRDAAPLSELEKLQASFRALPESEQEPALRTFAAEAPESAKYAWYELGNIYYDRAGEVLAEPGADPRQRFALLDSARVFFGRAAELDSSFVEALVNLGSVWEDIGSSPGSSLSQSRDKAREYYLRALDLRPEDEKARCNLGALYFSQRLIGKALAEFELAIEHNPGSALAHYNLAILFADAKIYREAIREWELAAENDGDGDIGRRSRENIEIIRQMMEAEIPAELMGDSAG